METEAATRRPLKTRDRAAAKKLAALLARRGVKPNAISVASIAFAAVGSGLLLTALLADHHAFFYLAFAVCIQLRLLCNMLDGMVAVEEGMATPLGALYNELPDRIADTFFIVAAGYVASPDMYGAGLGWSAALIALLTAYIRALGASLTGIQSFLGPMAKPHRMALLTASALLAAVLPLPWRPLLLQLALLVVIALGLVTAWRRLSVTAAALSSGHP